jgi:predicted Fe-Mo cluster-binding NifX family protein
MKITITSTGNELSAPIDSRFGRCSYFAFYDTETQRVFFFENPAKDSNEGAGPASAQFVASKEAKLVVSGNFGPKVKTIFDTLNIKMITMDDTIKTVGDAIKMLNLEK